jgi:aspartate/methionine/tyrosine aminotransferase
MNDYKVLFKLRPVKAAKVSEISESTASSPVTPAERVNFHIGNPVQDERLIEYFLKAVLGYSGEIDFKENWEEKVIEELGWDSDDKPLVSFLNTLIRNSAPYTPRGGYQKSNPHELINIFQNWLINNQQEALPYDIGAVSGKREIILSSGGITESLHVFIHALSNYLLTPVNIFLFHKKLPDHLLQYENINYTTISENEKEAVCQLNEYLQNNSDKPNFLMLGSVPSEDIRRRLRELSISYPLFFIEVNNAFNHQSLAREAKMVEKVIRFLTPEIFSSKYKLLSTIFIIGNPDFLNVIETVHFQLKGTPSASEIELLAFLIKNKIGIDHSANIKYIPEFDEDFESDKFSEPAVKILSELQQRIGKIAVANNQKVNNSIENIITFTNNITSPDLISRTSKTSDLLAFKNCRDVFRDFTSNLDSKDFFKILSDSFLAGFINNHKEYNEKYSVVVSGSSRTALGYLGFHCGITEVITTDLSWTYEHCFPKVTAIPLTEKFEIDIDSIKEKISDLTAADPTWNNKSAVIINNPNNATGRIFDETKIKELIKWCVNNKIYLIDDLSYQNVTPDLKIKEIKTLAQLSGELIKTGYIIEQDKRFIITVHSLSKTDALAGARLSVVEINDKELLQKFKKINQSQKPNIAAILLTYLLYRNNTSVVSNYWKLRNYIFSERMDAILKAKELLPKDRNPFGIEIMPAKGSMYPLLTIKKLPAGLSLDWISSGLARQGIGLVPLTTFARSEQGYELARTTFRLTLGGVDDKDTLHKKTRRVIIDLNRMIEEESLNYNKKSLSIHSSFIKSSHILTDKELYWNNVEKTAFSEYASIKKSQGYISDDLKNTENEFNDYLKSRLDLFRNKLIDKSILLSESLQLVRSSKSRLKEILEFEFYKDNLARRERAFKKRLYDRTVHPTQMYSLDVEIEANKIIDNIINHVEVKRESIKKFVGSIRSEYLGLNVAINSSDESAELLLDLDTLLNAESYISVSSDESFNSFLSFWGDWDGSNRPSGQGHRLVATVLIENVKRLSAFMKVLIQHNGLLNIPSDLRNDIENLKSKNENFIKILNDITDLTHQLEKRFKGILPYNIKSGKFREFAIKYHFSKDPVKSKWEHNDRLEHKMIDLRNERRRMFEVYFSLNKLLRKTLYESIPYICDNLGADDIAIHASQYKDLLKRAIITPRIHQKLITTQDHFAIDTTVYNINEINEISGKYGNPGMILSLQISMSTDPDAVILLDRKMRANQEDILRKNKGAVIPNIWLIPLFEDKDSTTDVESYLNKIWDYAFQSRKLNQDTADRFAKIICEIFIAGSDLSQFIGQPPAMALYKEAKYKIINWITEKALLGNIRIKLGSGEPMQRQGGYYAPQSGKPAFIKSNDSRLNKLKASTRKSAEYASTPLLGIFAGGDLRTLQSNISEKIRMLPIHDLSELLYHLYESQKFYENELQRAGEPLTETRLQFKTRGLQELERLTIGKRDSIYEEFLNIFTENFRHILYGKDDDVIGIHIISYFVARATPPLRDRPTIRPDKGSIGNRGQKILERISEMIPLSRYGSLLRAIAHNQSQTMILGVNQLTTGLFRSLDVFMQKNHPEGENLSLISDRILPHLPVYEILHSLRIYQDTELNYVGKMEKAFPAGNSAFHTLREDRDVMSKYIPIFQRELLRRHGLNVSEFFESSGFIADLLPTLRADIAVLMQQNIFNTVNDEFFIAIKGKVDKNWQKEIFELLVIPEKIKLWRESIWKILEKPVSQRVASFSELAIALNSISLKLKQKDFVFNEKKLPASITKYISTDDTMHQFLTAAVEYLSAFSETTELPVNIIKALNENKIIKIEEQPITADEQKLLRYYTLQIARLAGENG